MSIPYAEAAFQRRSHENVPRKIPPNAQENTHAEVRLHQSRRAALLKSHSNAGAPPQTNNPKTPCTIAPQRNFENTKNFKNILTHFLYQVVPI